MLKKLLFTLSLLSIVSIDHAIAQPITITLRNGAQATQARIQKVYNVLDVLHSRHDFQYYWLWRTAKKCKELGDNECVLTVLFKNADRHYLKPLETETLNFLEQQEIIRNGILDKETQDIIISSYRGTAEPKIVGIQYPVNTMNKMKYSLKTLWD